MKQPKGWKQGTVYPLGDMAPWALRDRIKPAFPRRIMAIWTPENGHRAPKRGEWYLSGSEGHVEAYQAGSDLSCEYFIATLVLAQQVTVHHIVEVLE